MGAQLARLSAEITACRACPRLVRCREAAARRPPRRFAGARYWARPVPGFGDPHARLLVVGLAPAANGANRTGRVFTGDRSGDWLYAATGSRSPTPTSRWWCAARRPATARRLPSATAAWGSSHASSPRCPA